MRYWSPKLLSLQPGVWIQFDGSRRIGVIRAVTIGTPPRPMLRAETWHPVAAERQLIGYFPDGERRLAALVLWEEYQAAIAAQKIGGTRGT
ncbi:hypothetical protein [Agromyces bauzanensis]